MTLTAPYLPTVERVAVAWLAEHVGAALGDAGIASNLPKTLPADGFVTARAVNPGLAPVDLPRYHSLVSIDTWSAPSADGGRVRWNAAAQLMARILDVMDNDRQTFNAAVSVGEEYLDAYVFAVWRDQEPRRVPDDPSAYARLTCDVNMDWSVLR